MCGSWVNFIIANVTNGTSPGADCNDGLGPYLGVAVLYWVLAIYVLRGGFGGLGTAPEFEHPVEER